MASQTVELLKECNSGCKMAINSIDQIMDYVKDAKQMELIHSYEKKHENLEKRIGEQLMLNGALEEEPGLMASAMSWVSTEMKMMMNQNDSQAAKIMMDGCNMGIQSVAEYLNKYIDASNESRELAKELLRMEEAFMKDMRQFL